MIVLSFVIPAYQAEPYLETCLASLVVPSAMMRYEVLIVDDGSQDKTINIAQKYVDLYPNTFHLHSKPNGGHGSVINTASKLVQGKYFKVIDADDWIVTETLVPLLDFLENSQADMVVHGFDEVDMVSREKVNYPVQCPKLFEDMAFSTWMSYYNQLHKLCAFHGILFATKTYRQAQVSLTEKIYYEDQEYIVLPVHMVQKVAVVPFILYQYLVGNVAQSVSDKNRIKNIEHISRVVKSLLCHYSTHRETMDNSHRQYVEKRISFVAASYLYPALFLHENRKLGYQMAKTMYQMVHSEISCKTLTRKYMLFCALHKLGIDHKRYQKWKRMLKR